MKNPLLTAASLCTLRESVAAKEMSNDKKYKGVTPAMNAGQAQKMLMMVQMLGS